MKLKYVMLNTINGEIPVLFPMALQHIQFKDFRPISAGFVNLDTFETFGNSVGLNLKPRPEDAVILKVFLTM